MAQSQAQSLKKIQFNNELYIPALGLFFSKGIYIRECYKAIYELIFRDKKYDVLLTGTPGIGKTFFGFYLIYRLLSEKTCKKFGYKFQKDLDCYYCYEDGSFKILKLQEIPISFLLIIDGHAPPSVTSR